MSETLLYEAKASVVVNAERSASPRTDAIIAFSELRFRVGSHADVA